MKYHCHPLTATLGPWPPLVAATFEHGCHQGWKYLLWSCPSCHKSFCKGQSDYHESKSRQTCSGSSHGVQAPIAPLGWTTCSLPPSSTSWPSGRAQSAPPTVLALPWAPAVLLAKKWPQRLTSLCLPNRLDVRTKSTKNGTIQNCMNPLLHSAMSLPSFQQPRFVPVQ